MKVFLDTLKLNHMTRLRFESFVYQMADRIVGDYDGGTWKTHTLADGVVILLIPADKDKSVTINVPEGNSLSTDHLTASAAFTFLVVNWFWNRVTRDLTADENEAFNAQYYGVRDAVYGDNFKGDKTAFFHLTD